MIDFEEKDRETSYEQAMQIAQMIFPLHRSITGEGIDAAFEILKDQVGCKIYEFPSFTDILSWTVPQSWRCIKVSVKHVKSGLELFDFDTPLRIASHSNAFSGTILGRELKLHCKVSHQAHSIMHQYRYYDDEWFISLTEAEYSSIIDDDEYNVNVHTEHYEGSLKVAEKIHKGDTDVEVAFLSHLCHPAQFNDGLVGVLLNIYIYFLLKNKKTHFSYKFLFMPETIGSIAYCSEHKNIKNINSAIFTEMIALDQPLHIQESASNKDFINSYLKLADRELNLNARFSPFLSVIRNDEKVFNSPGIDIPTASVTRALGREFPDHPYRTYHTHFDDIDSANIEKLKESLSFIETLIKIIESDKIVRRQFTGIPMLSKVGLFFDPAVNRDKYNLSERLVWLIAKPTTIAEIALQTEYNFSEINKMIRDWETAGLVKLEKINDFNR
ncbi:DUF4910 domain-containing protein [Rhodobacterales bacterium LSUCC1028]|nr:DUF4910 domain-containing protein [Rhodobacterales bacterium LSUCC1028]